MKEVRHYVHPQLLNPNHVIQIVIAGCGGTGSQVLRHLAIMNFSLWSMNHPGFHVTAFDDDTVTDANLGRQLFSNHDVGRHKSIALIERINRFYGYKWDGIPTKYAHTHKHMGSIFISCVDTAKTRVEFSKHSKDFWYWLDFGNSRHTGQAILGTCRDIHQPESKFITTETLPDVISVHPNLKKVKQEDNEPSCSLAASLMRQDLFINPGVAFFGTHMLWKMFRQGFLDYHGVYVNLNSLAVTALKLRENMAGLTTTDPKQKKKKKKKRK